MYNGKVKHLKKGDTVVALSGNDKGKSGKVLDVNHRGGVVKVDGLGMVKKHSKPSQTNPKGGIVEMNRWLPSCKLQLSSAAGKPLGRTGWKIDAKGTKTRVSSSSRKK